MTITRTDIDGVPVAFAPSDGPLSAGLAFRVGQADEPTARAGLTHLTRWLAGDRDADVGAVITTFRVRGDANEVVTFLDRVCRSLADLPLDQVPADRETMNAQADAATASPHDTLAMRRYGARGYGLPGFPALGLHVIDADELRQWAARFFTRANAMLWITGDAIPAGLRLPLPDGGARMPAPEATSILPKTPAYFLTDAEEPSIALQSIVRRGPAAIAYARLLDRALGGTQLVSYIPRDGGQATLVVMRDAPPGQRDSSIGELLDAMTALRYGRIPPVVSEPDVDDLPGYVWNELLGHVPPTGPASPEEVAAVAAEALDSALLAAPAGPGLEWTGFTFVHIGADSTEIKGRRHPLLGGRHAAMIIGPGGVAQEESGRFMTIRFPEVVAMLAWPGGARVLFGPFVRLVIEPTLYADIAAGIATIDAAVPAELRIDMPPRDPAEIPKPPGLLRRLVAR